LPEAVPDSDWARADAGKMSIEASRTQQFNCPGNRVRAPIIPAPP
jgi:hypothetical protein